MALVRVETEPGVYWQDDVPTRVRRLLALGCEPEDRFTEGDTVVIRYHDWRGGGVPVATTKKPAKAGKKVTKRTAK